jgi:hypothetical protein
MERTKYAEDRKLLGTIHTQGSIDEYYHVRKKYEGRTEFSFVLVCNTKSSVREYTISESQLPEKIKVR